jgi:hypothetical protein
LSRVCRVRSRTPLVARFARRPPKRPPGNNRDSTACFSHIRMGSSLKRASSFSTSSSKFCLKMSAAAHQWLSNNKQEMTVNKALFV